MDSETFLKGDERKRFAKKSGIYVFKSPMRYNNQDMYKIGYAYQSLSDRIANYKTAYGPIHFEIYCIYAIPERILNAPRTMWALGTEKQLHHTLFSHAVMKNEEDGKLEGEWFYNLDEILKTIRYLRYLHLQQIEGAENWELYLFGGMFTHFTKSHFVKLADITDTNSQFNHLQLRPFSTRKRTPKKFGNDYVEEENPTHNYAKDVNRWRGSSH